MLYVNTQTSNMTQVIHYRIGEPLERLGAWSNLADSAPEHSSSAGIVIHPTGRWLFVSNRGDDSITIFEVDPDGAALSLHDRVWFRADSSFDQSI